MTNAHVRPLTTNPCTPPPAPTPCTPPVQARLGGRALRCRRAGGACAQPVRAAVPQAGRARAPPSGALVSAVVGCSARVGSSWVHEPEALLAQAGSGACAAPSGALVATTAGAGWLHAAPAVPVP